MQQNSDNERDKEKRILLLEKRVKKMEEEQKEAKRTHEKELEERKRKHEKKLEEQKRKDEKDLILLERRLRGGGVSALNLSFEWCEPERLVHSSGSDWPYQMPDNNSVIQKKLLDYFAAWEACKLDKAHTPLFAVLGAPGSGKSRMLEQVKSIMMASCEAVPDGSSSNGDGERADRRLHKRLCESLVFLVSFENDTAFMNKESVDQAKSFIPARMMWQLRNREKPGFSSFEEFWYSPDADKLSMDDVFNELAKIRKCPPGDLTLLVAVDGLQEPGAHFTKTSYVSTVLESLCSFMRSTPFAICVCAATVRAPVEDCFEKPVNSELVHLLPHRMDGTLIIDGESSPLLDLLVKDMDGHGRALEVVQKVLTDNSSRSLNFKDIFDNTVLLLEQKYQGWELFNKHSNEILGATIVGYRFAGLTSVVPGTQVSVEKIVSIGLVRFDETSHRLLVPFVWAFILSKRSNIHPRLIFNDYQEINEKLTRGSSAALSYQAFEEFVARFRVLKSAIFPAGALSWEELHVGAEFGPDCDVTVTNKIYEYHCTRSRVNTQSISSSKNVVRFEDQKEAPLHEVDAVVVNARGAPSGDIFLSLECPVEAITVTEIFQCKRLDSSVLTAQEFSRERDIACGPDDFFILVSNGRVQKQDDRDKWPKRSAVVCADTYDAYFGPFAGRAFLFSLPDNVNVNNASRTQLENLPQMNKKIAEAIIAKRPFSNMGKLCEQVPEIDGRYEAQKRVRFTSTT